MTYKKRQNLYINRKTFVCDIYEIWESIQSKFEDELSKSDSRLEPVIENESKLLFYFWPTPWSREKRIIHFSKQKKKNPVFGENVRVLKKGDFLILHASNWAVEVRIPIFNLQRKIEVAVCQKKKFRFFFLKYIF